MPRSAKTGTGVLLLSFLILCLSLLRGFVIPACRGFLADPSVGVGDGAMIPADLSDAAAKILYGIPIDVNGASAEDLTLLVGIGPVLAKRIVEHRDSEGPFASTEDLKDVKGIGPKKFDRIQGHISVSGGTGSTPSIPKKTSFPRRRESSS